jgi:hypothetical protein
VCVCVCVSVCVYVHVYLHVYVYVDVCLPTVIDLIRLNHVAKTKFSRGWCEQSKIGQAR